MRGDVELFLDAYTGEFVEFAAAVREGRPPAVDRRGRPRGARRRAGLHRVGRRRDADRVARSREATTGDASRWPSAPRWSSSTCRSSSGYAGSTTLGFAVEIWDWTEQDLDELAATGRDVHVDDRATSRGDLIDPDGADELLRDRARVRRRVAARWASRRLNLHGTGLDGRGLPVKPVEAVTGEMWLAAEPTLAAIAELGEAEDVVFTLENLNTAVDHPGTPFARAADTCALVARSTARTCG